MRWLRRGYLNLEQIGSWRRWMGGLSAGEWVMSSHVASLEYEHEDSGDTLTPLVPLLTQANWE